MTTFILFENASGYALFERLQSEAVGEQMDQVQEAILDAGRFTKMMKLKAFVPFKSAENALANINAVSECDITEDLQNFLEMNLPKGGKKAGYKVGVSDAKLGNAIQEAGFPCTSGKNIDELIRGIRMHFYTFLKALKDGDLEKAQLGLAHSYSRAKVKFNVNRADNMIIQSICLLDQLDKDINTFAMRVREWYSWHFPELVKIVNDNIVFARLAKFIKSKSSINEDSLDELENISGDAGKAKQILDAARSSMGTDISEIDMLNIENFATRVVSLADYRKKLHGYLVSRMNNVAPNLSALIGEQVGARLISHAGSLTNLAKYPASTVQILGAEKALFRALKTKGNTPKYGLIFHSSFIGRAGQKNKGRISRYLANKCSIASRIDCFNDDTTDKFGVKLREQVEERLNFYDTGETPKKNIDAMKEVMAMVEKPAANGDKKKKEKKEKKDKKRSAEEEPAVEETPAKKKKKGDGEESAKKKKKKDKK